MDSVILIFYKILSIGTRCMYLITVLSLLIVNTYEGSWNRFWICFTITILGWAFRELFYYSFYRDEYDKSGLRPRLFQLYTINVDMSEKVGVINGSISAIVGLYRYTLTSEKKLRRLYRKVEDENVFRHISAFKLILLKSGNYHYSSSSDRYDFAVSALGLNMQSASEFMNDTFSQRNPFPYNKALILIMISIPVGMILTFYYLYQICPHLFIFGG